MIAFSTPLAGYDTPTDDGVPRAPWEIRERHVLAGLRELPDARFQCVITSIPYLGLRAYDTTPQLWGGDPACAHTWDEQTIRQTAGGPRANGSSDAGTGRGQAPGARQGHRCGRCGGWRGELGQEPDIDLYLAHVVAVFAEVRRVLRPDGTLWLNVGDPHSRDGKWGGRSGGRPLQNSRAVGNPRTRLRTGLGDGQLMLLPARVALALQADGWILRNELIWHKINPLPESVRSRFTKAHEQIFLFSKGRRYYCDMFAVREPATGGAHARGKGRTPKAATAPDGVRANPSFHAATAGLLTDRNARDVWSLVSEPTRAEHHAAFPTEIPRRAILAGTSAHGACPACGSPWRRLLRKTGAVCQRGTTAPRLLAVHPELSASSVARSGEVATYETSGWAPTCACVNAGEPVPQWVLDPFAGSGTSVLVARQLGRYGLGLDLQPTYCAMARRRIHDAAPLFDEPPPQRVPA